MTLATPRRLMAALTVLVSAGAGRATEAELGSDFRMELALVGAVFPPHVGSSSHNSSLLMDLWCHGDRWDRVWVTARNYNLALHSGRVEAATVSPDSIVLGLAVVMARDGWVAGGRGKYEVRLKRAADGALGGEFSGSFLDVPLKGRAYGRMGPQAAPWPDYVPVQPGEHPRILFRRSDIPRLRDRAKVPLGEAALARMGSAEGCGDAIGMGVKYHVTGDKKWADSARASTAKHIADVSVPAFARGRQWGSRIEQVAVSYDLCYDAWPESFRKEVESYLRFVSYQAFYDQRKLGESINWTVGSNYAGPIYAGVGFAGLALWGEKGPEPAKPSPPTGVETLPPAADFTPQQGVPVAPLELGRSPRKWLITEGMTFAMGNDPMVSLCGLERLRPKPGDKVTVDHYEATFSPLDPEFATPDGGIALRTGLKKGRILTLLAYTVVELDRPRTLRLRAPFSRSGRLQVVLNGVAVEHEQVLKMEKGLYPMLVVLRLAADWRALEPWLEEASDEDARKYAASSPRKQAEYQEKVKDWEYDVAEWRRLGGADVNYLRTYAQGRGMMYLFCREACGTGGYQTEAGHYFNDGLDGPDRYAAGYRIMFGRDISPFFDIAAYIPRLIHGTVYLPNGGERYLGISSSVSANGTRVAALFPVIPDELKPAVLRHWNRDTGGDALKPDLKKIAQANPVYSFLYYPLDMKPQAPATVMPLNWQAPDRGYFAFRNAWSGGDDIVFQFLGRTKGSHGWGGPDGGSFRLQGLGHVWATGNTGREVRRWVESVVNLPEDSEVPFGGKGRITYARFDKDGSGAVSYDYTDSCYTKAQKDAPWQEVYGGIIHPAGPDAKPLCTALRAVAVDFSGLSGAPCLLAIVDRIEGGKTKEWFWQVPDIKAAAATDNGFTVTQGDASLRAIFAAPARPSIEITREGRRTTKSAGHMAGSEIIINLSAAIVQGADPNDGRFFMVGTLQRGQPPAAKIEGQGLDAKVSVGKRVVRFDGQKVVLDTTN